MAGNTIPTNKAQQAKPTDPKQATQQAPKNHEGMPELAGAAKSIEFVE